LAVKTAVSVPVSLAVKLPVIPLGAELAPAKLSLPVSEVFKLPRTVNLPVVEDISLPVSEEARLPETGSTPVMTQESKPVSEAMRLPETNPGPAPPDWSRVSNIYYTINVLS
jgi:hypothetical protein